MATSLNDIWNATSKTVSDAVNSVSNISSAKKKEFDDLLTEVNIQILELQNSQIAAQAYIKTITDMQIRANAEALQATALADMEAQVYSVWRAIRPYTNFFTINGKVVSQLNAQNFAIIYASSSIDSLKLLISRIKALIAREKAIATASTPSSAMPLALVGAAGLTILIGYVFMTGNK